MIIPIKNEDGEMVDVEAISLIMRKEFAEQIVAGTKTFEIRIASPFYDRIFLDPVGNNKWRKTDYPWGDVPWREDVPFVVHFHNYNNSWSLDVEVEEFHFVVPIPEEEEEIHSWGCHEFDEILDEYKNLTPEQAKNTNINFFYAIKLGAILNSTNLS